MKLSSDSSLARSLRVLALIKVSEAARMSVAVGCYSNGREQGLSVRLLFGKVVTISWSECRTSDQMVVYVSEPGEAFAHDSRTPTERAYRAAEYFSDEKRAAKFIGKKIREAM